MQFQINGIVVDQSKKNAILKGILHGRRGVIQACNCRSVLDAIASLIDARRPDLAMVLIEKELNSQT